MARGREPVTHGSASGAVLHYRRGEKPCESCRLNYNTAQRRRYRRQHDRPLFTPERVSDFLLMNEPSSVRSIVDGVEAAEETILRAVYRMTNRGEITCNSATRLYTIDRQEG